MSSFEKIKKLYPDCVQKAKSYDYSKSSICILDGDESTLLNDFPSTYNNLLSCKHNRDSRLPIEYGQDLVASWLIEDILVNDLKSFDIDIELTGADKNREVLFTSKISSSSDCIIKSKTKSRNLEIMCDYTGFWMRNKKLHLRDCKHLKLKNEKSLLLGISLIDSKYILLDYNNKLPAKFVEKHYPFNKPAYEITIKDTDIKDFSIKILAHELLTYLL